MDNQIEYDYQSKWKSDLKVKITSIGYWDIHAIRSDNGKEDVFPIDYFQDCFEEI